MSFMAIDMPQLGTSHNNKMCPTGHLADVALVGHNAPMIQNNIATLRKRAGLSQTELATRIGTTLNMMGKLERGERTLDMDWIEKIARALRVQPYELIGPISSNPAPAPATSVVSLPVSLPSEGALREMFVDLLETIDVDPHQDERAERLARSFPGLFGAVALLQDSSRSSPEKARARPPRIAGANRPSKAQ
jgi:transcriptional regulator with XRE-family HTH domain